jgi:Zn finger protein HypA/HybF involved in hydrogenase expression
MNNEYIIEVVKNSSSIANAMEKLNEGRRFVKRKIEELSIDTSHMTGQAWTSGKTVMQDSRLSKYSKEEIFSEDSPCSNSYVRKFVLKNKLKEYKCESCELVNWKNQNINLQLDHINGNRKDNRLENLRWLCPNCHSQTSTFCSRNVKSKRYSDELIISLCKKHGNVRGVVEELGCNPRLYGRIKRLAKENGIEFPNQYGQGKVAREKQTKAANEKQKSEYSAKNKSKEWLEKIGMANRRVERPSKEDLTKLIESVPIETIGKQYGVSGNAVRKWCKTYGIQPKPVGYWQKKQFGKI